MIHALSASIFQNFPYDNIQDRNPVGTFQLPFQNDHGMVEVGVVSLDFGFWLIAFVLLCGQAAFNAFVAFVTYEYLLPQRNSNSIHHLVLGYGFVVPGLLLGALWIFYYWQCRNITLMLCAFGAVPVLTLRVIEAMHGKLPDYCTASRRMTCLYFASTLLLAVDEKGHCPIPLTRPILWSKACHFVNVFLQTGALLSVLLATDYQVFPSLKHHTFYWGNLGNSFLLASLTSLVLDGGASGLGLLTSCITGYVLEDFHDAPLTQSTSLSDFWGRRWDRPVQSALRRGCYAPLRDTYSSAFASFVTFLVSGLVHEYVLLVMSLRGGHTFSPQYGRQFIFFVWNGIVLLLERYWKQGTKDKESSMMNHLPKPVQTALVLMIVLPIGHYFTDEYIRASFYDDCSWGFPIVVLMRQE